MGEGAVQSDKTALFLVNDFVIVVFAGGKEFLELIGKVRIMLARVEACKIVRHSIAVAVCTCATRIGQNVLVTDALLVECGAYTVRHAVEIICRGDFVRLRDDDELRNVLIEGIQKVEIVVADDAGVGRDEPEDMVARVQLTACNLGIRACGVGGTVGLGVARCVEEGNPRIGVERCLDKHAAQEMSERGFFGFLILAESVREGANVRNLHGDACTKDIDAACCLVRAAQNVGGDGGGGRDGGRQEACAAEQSVEKARLPAAEPAAERDDGLADERAKEQEIIEAVIDVAKIEVERGEIGRGILLKCLGQTLLDGVLQFLKPCGQNPLIAVRVDDLLEEGNLLLGCDVGHGNLLFGVNNMVSNMSNYGRCYRSRLIDIGKLYV